MPTDQPDLIPPMLLKADIPIYLINTMTTPLTSILTNTTIFRNPNAIILLTPIPTSRELAEHLHILLAKAGSVPPEGHESEGTHSGGARVLFVDPERGLQALDVLCADPKDLRNIHIYQQNFMDSNIQLIHAAVADIVEKSPTGISSLRADTACTLIRFALEACKDSIKQVEWDIDVACSRVSEVRSKVEEAKARVRGEVLGTKESDEVQRAMKDAEKDMKRIMDGLTWWKMIWSVDEIGQVVGNSIRRVWCKDLEEKARFYPLALIWS
jgi:hypothetical protein